MNLIDAVVENGVLKPLSPLAMKEQEQVRLAIVPPDSTDLSFQNSVG
jgi:predicted DNA-binding antitoxin AbrB/MazE fold protein